MDSTALVIARKFNDIIYSVSCDEFVSAGVKKLLIISDKKNEKFPMTEIFDDVIYLYEPDVSAKGQFRLLTKINRISSRIKADTVFMSNIILLSHYFIVRKTRCRRIILIEDGFMNYRSTRFDNNWKKDVLLRLMGFSKDYMTRRVERTYLLNPAKAKYFFGNLKTLELKGNNSEGYKGPSLAGKRIFIGQPLYKSTQMTVEQYNHYVNDIIKKYKIDYYVPHFNAGSEENIKAPALKLSDYGLTFELLASRYTFSLYSFSSSVLFTTRWVNPEIKSVRIAVPGVYQVSDKTIFEESGVLLETL